jgi:SAM-dependent methyltransferase
MDDRVVGDHWEANAAAWTTLVRAGYDVFRDLVNTPAFLTMLPEVDGKRGIDIGCGEGANTRTVARRGARMTGIDIAPTFIGAAREAERGEPLGIEYVLASATALPFEDAAFDFATAFMSLMDVADFEGALREAGRVVAPGGFLQFSMMHPCFGAAPRVRDERGEVESIVVSDYYDRREFVEEWTFSDAPGATALPKFRIPYFHRSLADWFDAVAAAGFVVERLAEPRASAEAIGRAPRLAAIRHVPLFMILRCRKP